MERQRPLERALQIVHNPAVKAAANLGLKQLDQVLVESGAYKKIRDIAQENLPPQAVNALERSRAARRRAEALQAKKRIGLGCLLSAADKGSDLAAIFTPSIFGFGVEDIKAILEGGTTLVSAALTKDKVGWDFSGKRVDMVDATLNLVAGAFPAPVLIAHPFLRWLRRKVEDTTLPPEMPIRVNDYQTLAQSAGMNRAIELPVEMSEEYLWLARNIEIHSTKRQTKLSEKVKNTGHRLEKWSHQEPAPIPDMYLHAFNGLLLAVALGVVTKSVGTSFQNMGGMLEVLINTPTDGWGPVGSQAATIIESMGRNILAGGGLGATIYANPFRRTDENSSVVLPVLGKTIEGWGNNIAAVEHLTEKIRTRITPR